MGGDADLLITILDSSCDDSTKQDRVAPFLQNADDKLVACFVTDHGRWDKQKQAFSGTPNLKLVQANLQKLLQMERQASADTEMTMSDDDDDDEVKSSGAIRGSEEPEDGLSESGGLTRQSSQTHLASLKMESKEWREEVNHIVKTQMGFGGEKLALHDLFLGDSHFVIPPFQRPYVWPKEMVFDLVQGIFTYFELQKEFYYVGNIFIWYNTNKHKCTIKKVLDGQQRLTTLTLLLSVVRILLQEKHQEVTYDQGSDGAPKTGRKLMRTLKKYLLDDDDEDEAVCRLRPKGPNLQSFFNRLQTFTNTRELHCALEELTSDKNSRFEQTIRNAINAILAFLQGDASKLEGEKHNLPLAEDGIRLCRFIEHIRMNVYFSHTWIENVEDKYEEVALDFFLRVNQNGTVLSYSDTLKARLLCRIPKEENEEHARVWDCVETRLKTFNVTTKDDFDGQQSEEKDQVHAFDHLFQILIGATCKVDMNQDMKKLTNNVRKQIEDHTPTTEGAKRMMYYIELFGTAYLMILERLGDIPEDAKSRTLRKTYSGSDCIFGGNEQHKYHFLVVIGKLHWFNDSIQKRFWHPIAVTLVAIFLQMDEETRSAQTKLLLERLNNLVAWTFFYSFTDDPGFRGQHYKEKKTQMLTAIMGQNDIFNLPGSADFGTNAMKEAFGSKFPKPLKQGPATPSKAGSKRPAQGTDDSASSSPVHAQKKKKTSTGVVVSSASAVMTEREVRAKVGEMTYATAQSKVAICKATLLLYEMALKEKATECWKERFEHLRLLDGLDRDAETNVPFKKADKSQVEHILPELKEDDLSNERPGGRSPWAADRTFQMTWDGEEKCTVVAGKQCSDFANMATRKVQQHNISNLVLVPAKRAKIVRDDTFAFRRKLWLTQSEPKATQPSQLLSFIELQEFSEPADITVNGIKQVHNEMHTVQQVPPPSTEVEEIELQCGSAQVKKGKVIFNFGGKRWTCKSINSRRARIVDYVTPILFPNNQ